MPSTPPGHPFDDPEVRAFMRANNIIHTPGLAQQHLDEIAPLLASEGIDLDNLGDVDLDTVNAALARATEQHNLMLATPVGAQRDSAIAVLRNAAKAIADGNIALAQGILDNIHPDGSPSVSHVIGAALGLLDEWPTDAARIPNWPTARSRKAGTDILALARASAEGTDADTVADLLLTSAEPQPDPGAAFRRPAEPAGAPTTFGHWLERNAPDIAAPSAIDEFTLFHALTLSAAEDGLDLGNPDDIGASIDLLYEDEDEDFVAMALATLYDYARYQIETSRVPDAWEAVLDEIADALDETDLLLAPLHEAIAAESDIPMERRRARLAQTRIASAVPALLEWIGKGRAITSTGNLRRADIEPFSALIGIAAEGVANVDDWYPPLGDDPNVAAPEPRVHRVQSFSQATVPFAWWEALQVTEILEVGKTRFHPGRNADAWKGDPDLDDLDMLVGSFICELLVDRDDRYGYAEARTMTAVDLLLQILDPDAEITPVTRNPDPLAMDRIAWLRPGALRTMNRLADLGILDHKRGTYVAPPELRGTIARGILMAIAMLDAALEDD